MPDIIEGQEFDLAMALKKQREALAEEGKEEREIEDEKLSQYYSKVKAKYAERGVTLPDAPSMRSNEASQREIRFDDGTTATVRMTQNEFDALTESERRKAEYAKIPQEERWAREAAVREHEELKSEMEVKYQDIAEMLTQIDHLPEEVRQLAKQEAYEAYTEKTDEGDKDLDKLTAKVRSWWNTHHKEATNTAKLSHGFQQTLSDEQWFKLNKDTHISEGRI